MQELGLSIYSAESRDVAATASSEGQQYHALFNTFYRLVYEHIASLVEVSPLQCCATQMMSILRHPDQTLWYALQYKYLMTPRA